MLKTVQPINLQQKLETKCAEIFCHNYTDLTIYCSFCDIKSFALDDFLLHLQNIHYENNPLMNDKIIDVDPEDNLNDCSEKCELVEGDDSFSCHQEECLKILKREIPIITNEDISSPGKDNYNDEFQSCTIKDDTSNSKTKKSSYTPPEFPCPDCPQIFNLKYLVDDHVVEVHKGYKCSQCDKRFRHRHHLRRHELTHNPVREFPCPVPECGKIFTNPEYCKRHLEIHNLECKFKCDFKNCSKSFQTPSRLKQHKTTHNIKRNSTDDIIKYVCDICGYSCRALMYLEIHQRIHTGEKPFRCDVCEKCFISKAARNSHMITHSNKRDFICNICQAGFTKKVILQNHMHKHSDEKKFNCQYCNKNFKQRNGLDYHILYVHKKTKPWPVKRKKQKLQINLNLEN